MANGEERFVELDLLRFFAAFSVMIYHYKTKYFEARPFDSGLAETFYEITKFGYLGVDLFFIISGLVILHSATGCSCSRFAISRFTRLYPTLWICMTFTAIISLSLKGAESEITILQWLTNLTIMSSYLGQNYIDGVYWTLLIEIKFYFLIFMLLMAGVIKYERIWLTVWLIATITFALFKQPFFMGWFISPEYSPHFIAGTTFFLIRRDGLQLFYAVILFVSLVMSCCYAYIASSSFVRDITTPERLMAVLIIAFFYVILLLISTKRFSLIGPRTLLLILGGVTYPLYLLHNRLGKEIFDAFKGTIDVVPLLIVIATGMMAVSLCVHLTLEKQFADRVKVFLIGFLGK